MVGAVLPEKRLVWDPRKGNKFVVGGGSQITLYEWAPDYPEIRHITSQHDLQLMKCFSWSPDASFEDLIAVGHSTGRVDLIRLEAAKYARRNNVLSSGPIVSLPVRNSRSCNALAFCAEDPNYLAVGLDKVRGDSSLVIWDINTALPALSLPVSSPNTSTNFASTATRPHPQIPRGDVGPRTDTKILQQHAPTEIVSSLSFLPQTTHLLLAGISHRWLRLFDLRSPVPSTSSVASKVHGIVTDPFDAHRIGCFGDGLVTIWDARKFLHPVLTFTERDASADGARVRSNSVYTTVEFSSTRRGMLATMERDASYVRLWDLMHAQGSRLDGNGTEGDRSRDSSMSSVQLTKRSWANLPWTANPTNSQTIPSPKESESSMSVVLSNTRRTKEFPRQLASFALVPSSQPYPLTSDMMVVNKEGDLELYAVHDTPKATTWSSRGDLVVGAGQTYQVLSGQREEDELQEEPWGISRAPSQAAKAQTISRSRSGPSREESSIRGRGRGRRSEAAPSPPMFGRGDEDGFPALTPAASKTTNLAATRPNEARTYSPASLRSHTLYREGSDPLRDGKDAANHSRSKHGNHDSDAATVEAPSRGRSHVKNRNQSSNRRQHSTGVGNVVQDDISMTMRRLVIRGYGIGDPHHNASIIRTGLNPSENITQMLSELWSWIDHSQDYLCLPTSRLNGYDFSYEGLLGIWEGLQPMPNASTLETPVPRDLLNLPDILPPHHERHSNRRSHSPADDFHGNYHAALSSLSLRRGVDRSSYKPDVSTTRHLQRQVALQLCGWGFKDDELVNEIKRWEKDGKQSRAACWLVFTRQSSKAIELLMRSDDEAHHMMSGTLAALSSHTSPRTQEFREHCERLIVRLQDPYFRAMLTYLTLGDWSEVLDEEVLPFRERLAIAFQFLDDKALTSYLRRCATRSCARGDIDAIIVTGLTKPGLDILQSYVDRTGDVQTAAILASYVCPWKFPDDRAERWIESYRDLLDGFKLHHHRVAFDIDRGHILQGAIQSGDMPPVNWAPSHILIRCNYCNKIVNVPGAVSPTKGNSTSCPHCNRALPRCSICLMTLGIVQDRAREAELTHAQYKDTIDDAIVICQTCRHGGHAAHLLDWFFGGDGTEAHGVCAVADCDCQCANDF